MADETAAALNARSPVEPSSSLAPERVPEPGIGLCLSGGGFRAMLFHTGVLWRLHDSGVLHQLSRVSSVSGGSLTSGLLALKWHALAAEPGGRTVFEREIVVPIRRFASQSIDVSSILFGLLLPGDIGDYVASAYDKYLFHGASLQALPDAPVFIFNATNVQSGVLWRFSKRYMRDYRVGEVRQPNLPLSKAVAASSAFPPFLSPIELQLDPSSFTPGSGDDLQVEPFTSRVMLSDGGVYDNLGLETVWKRFKTVLVSDAGGGFSAEAKPARDWAQHSYRVLGMIDNQVRSLRKRQLIASYEADPGDAAHRSGAYWGIRTDIAKYGLADALPAPLARTTVLADTPTGLSALAPLLQEQLINWGYAICDAALRRHVDPTLLKPADLPYPASAV